MGPLNSLSTLPISYSEIKSVITIIIITLKSTFIHYILVCELDHAADQGQNNVHPIG